MDQRPPMPQRDHSVTVSRVVGPGDTARALGSGELEVLATPRLLAWCEQATLVALEGTAAPGRTSVGTRIDLAHDRASAVGSVLEVTARLAHVDGRLLRFEVTATQEGSDGSVHRVGHGEVTRVVVDRDRFLGRLQPPGHA